MEILVPNSQQRFSFSNNFCKGWPPNTVDLNRLIMLLCVCGTMLQCYQKFYSRPTNIDELKKFCSQF